MRTDYPSLCLYLSSVSLCQSVAAKETLPPRDHKKESAPDRRMAVLLKQV